MIRTAPIWRNISISLTDKVVSLNPRIATSVEPKEFWYVFMSITGSRIDQWTSGRLPKKSLQDTTHARGFRPSCRWLIPGLAQIDPIARPSLAKLFSSNAASW